MVLRDRQRLSSDGIATVVIAIDAQTGAVVSDFELVVRGLPAGEDDPVWEDARQVVAKALERTQSEHATDQGVVSRAVRDALSKFVWERLRLRPMIIPIVLEV